MSINIQAFFSEGKRQQLFNVLVSPVNMQNCKAILLFIPALWDEMNHSRHIVAAQARVFATDGIATLILDPEGTGDSYGESAATNWDIWINDYLTVWEQLSAKYGIPIIFWGMRAGALLACELHKRCDRKEAPLLLWNPVLDGDSILREMIRIKLAGLMMSNDNSITSKSIRAELEHGNSVNMAGYDISGEFAEHMRAQKLVNHIPDNSIVLWIDVLRNVTAKDPPAKANLQKQLSDNNSKVIYSKVEGPSFWQSVELESLPQLLSTTQVELRQLL